MVRLSPAEPKASQFTPAREKEILPDLLKGATTEESKPTKAANSAPAEEGNPQQPESDAQAELEVSSKPANPSALPPSLACEAKAKGERTVVWPLQHSYHVLAFFAITSCLQKSWKGHLGHHYPLLVKHTFEFSGSAACVDPVNNGVLFRKP